MPQKPHVNIGEPAPFNGGMFFEEVLTNREGAMAMIRAQVPDEGPPTPRAATYIQSGEWDSDSVFPIVFLGEGVCGGHVRSTSSVLPMQFCGLAGNCTWGRIHSGWFIPAGTSNRSGFFKTPSLPPHSSGGPILQEIANALRGNDPFRLTVGQWKFVFEEWHASRVETVDDSSSNTSGSGLVHDDTEQPEGAFWSLGGTGRGAPVALGIQGVQQVQGVQQGDIEERVINLESLCASLQSELVRVSNSNLGNRILCLENDYRRTTVDPAGVSYNSCLRKSSS
jgi:hypothetical protein